MSNSIKGATETITLTLANGRGDWGQIKGVTPAEVEELNAISEAQKVPHDPSAVESYLNARSKDQTFSVRTPERSAPSTMGVAYGREEERRRNPGLSSVLITRFPGKGQVTRTVIQTAMGRSDDWRRLGLTKEQIADLNNIGYTGKTIAGQKTDFEAYLNSLDNGHHYQVIKTGEDTGDFFEAWDVLAFKAGA